MSPRANGQVGVPYLRARAQDYYIRLGGGQDPENLPPDTIVPATRVCRSHHPSEPADPPQSQRLFKRLYPYLNLTLDLTFLSYDLAYLFIRTDHYRPWHRLLGVHIERDTGDRTPPPSRLFDKLPPLLPPLLLLLKLSQWWYSPSSPRALPSTTAVSGGSYHAQILPPRPLPILPSSGILPPTPPSTPPATAKDPAQAFSVTKESYGDCPICGNKWQNPAVLPSGWVVCWKCGYDAVEGEDADGRCPITGVAVGPGELRRVLV